MAKKKKPTDSFAAELAAERYERMTFYRKALFYHGMLSEAENRNVYQRIDKINPTKPRK
jgi:hypothetical protein